MKSYPQSPFLMLKIPDLAENSPSLCCVMTWTCALKWGGMGRVGSLSSTNIFRLVVTCAKENHSHYQNLRSYWQLVHKSTCTHSTLIQVYDLSNHLTRLIQPTSYQETDSSAHLDGQSNQHHTSLNSRFDLQSRSALLLFSKTTESHALFAPQWYLDNPSACLRRCVCGQALIG